MSSTRAARKPRSAKTREPASRRRRIVLRPCARNSREGAGSTASLAAPLRRADLYASRLVPNTGAGAARRFGDRTAYVTESDWSVTYADIDRISDEVAVGLAREGVFGGDGVGLFPPPGAEYLPPSFAAPH